MKKIVLFMVAMLLLFSCSYNLNSKYSAVLPINSETIKECGNSWILFNFEGCFFLYNVDTHALTQISEK